MLTTLRIKNLALVAELIWEPGAGLNVVTGETGAGKSVLLGGLQLVLGQRADRGMIRSGADQCTVEAVFSVEKIQTHLNGWLEEHGLEPIEDGVLIVRRSFTTAGTNRQYINGSPTTVSLLAKLGDSLVDLHGPHEHQSLLQVSKQLTILDAYAGLDKERASMAAAMEQHRRLESARAGLVLDDATIAQRLDLLRYQVREISDASLSPDEESLLDREYRRVTNASRLMELAQGCLEVLSDNEGSVLDGMGGTGRLLGELARLDSSASEWAELHQQGMEQLNELQQGLSRYLEGIEVEPERQLELEQRLHVLQSLKRKYGGNIEAILAFGSAAEQELASLEGREAELERLDQLLADSRSRLQSVSEVLTSARRRWIPKLSKAVQEELRSLGFRQSRFSVELSAAPNISSTGSDQIEFLFAPNPGEPPRPLRAIASSGELARVMLGLKTVLAVQDEVPVLVFDEVDANVGGETAHVVGQKMAQIAKTHQVLCITHLPQVASCANCHYLVEKEVEQGRTLSRLTRLNGEARTEEIARMLGGGKAARHHAQALLNGEIKSE